MAVLQNGTTQVLQTRFYNPGVFTIPVTDMQVGQSKITIAADRNNWDDTGSDVISLRFDVSLDGGTNWQLLAGFTAKGGGAGAIDPWGSPITQSTFTMTIPESQNSNRKIRGSATIFTRINTAAYVTVS